MQAPGESLVIKMWETLTERGIGALLRPWQMRREGRASIEVRKQELLQLAQAEFDAAAIRAGKLSLHPRGASISAATSPLKQESIAEHSATGVETQHLVLQTVTESTIADAVRREVNVAKAIIFAEEDLQQDQSSTSSNESTEARQSIDPDWLYRWRDAASEVSAEELQHLWGRVLAGEVRAPGAFSLRTLEFLRNVSRSEAEAIELLSHYSLGECIYRADQKVLDAQGLSLQFLLAMQDLGIISGVGGLGLTLTLGTIRPDLFQRAFIIGHRVLIVTHSDANRTLELPVFAVTRLGQEVFSLVPRKPPEGYLRALGEMAIGKGFEAQIASGYDVPGGRFQFFDAERIASPPQA